MKEKLIRFMQGRYGIDQLSKFLLITGLAVVLLSAFFGETAVSMLLYIFGWGSRDLLLFSDIFKKCTEAVRRKSGISYENIQDKKLVSESKKTSGSREKCTTFIHVRHVNKKSASRRAKGKIEVRCPKCGTTFIKKKLSCADNENIELKSKKSP